MKVHTILPGALYQRGNCLSLSAGEKATLLREYRISVVANLWLRADPDLERLAEVYIHHPIPDGATVEAAPIEEIAETVAAYIGDGKAALIQCHAGRNRSGFLSALIVMRVLGVGGPEALAVVRAGRPNAVANPTFSTYLEALQCP